MRAAHQRTEARHAYDWLWGDCVALALALHERTGWPIVQVVGERDGRQGFHVGVRMPDGRVLDGEGAHGREAWLAAYAADRMTREEFEPRDTPEARAVMHAARGAAARVIAGLARPAAA